MSASSSQTDSPDDPDSSDASSSDSAYEPPSVEALGQLPESTGMPASPQNFPPPPDR